MMRLKWKFNKTKYLNNKDKQKKKKRNRLYMHKSFWTKNVIFRKYIKFLNE